ncbi:hypothetical protein K3495_g10259 [Podosphaera aphanis]|nr:hypothetical protein K3495_g10259 [Podosphaera aphanis]
MQFYSVFTAIFIFLTTIAAFSTPNRADVVTLYAYGANITGLPVQYAYDSKTNTGLAYIGTAKSYSRLRFRVTNDSSIPWVARVNTVTVGYFYISRKTSAAAVGFPSSKNNAGSNPVMTGFSILKEQVVFTGNLSTESYFQAKRTAELNVWALMWHPENRTIDGATPVTLRTVPLSTTQSDR